MKYTDYLLVPALFALSLQACGSKVAKGEADFQPAAHNPASSQPDSQQSNETAVSAPSEFKEVFTGAIDEKLVVRMSLERKGSDLTGGYFYERSGAFNSVMRTLALEGQIDGDGNVTLTETATDGGNERKTGEFKGKLDGLKSNGDLRLRFSGLWTGNDGKQMPFKFLALRFDLSGLKLVEKNEKSANNKPLYEIETTLPQLAGADSSRVEKFNHAAANMAAARLGDFKKELADLASESAGRDQKSQSPLPSSYLDVGYEITAANKDFISVLFYFNGYMRGAAHPNTNTESFNYDLKSNAAVNLADLFAPNSNYLQVVSDYSVKELKKLKTAEWVEEGAGPKAENFHSWNITPAGLRLTFDNYDVGPYAVGEHVVVIPYSVLKPISKADGLLAQFAK
jgi:hypothetical protein